MSEQMKMVVNSGKGVPYKLKGISHFYQLDQSISIFRVVGSYFSFLFKIWHKSISFGSIFFHLASVGYNF